MPVRWKLFKAICIMQMLASSVLMIMAIIDLIKNMKLFILIVILMYLLMFLQTILAVNILNNNYPDAPVAGKQKTNFNRLFLLNFLFLVILFGVIFAEYRMLKEVAGLIDRRMTALPVQFYISIAANSILLVFQLTILYGLYFLRLELYRNFMRREFDFEKP